MVDVASALQISTHYYKIAHLLLVTFAIYTAKEPTVDQYLLELELQIRNQHPKILLTYYNKSLYHFRFDHLKEERDFVNNEQHQKDDTSNLQLHILYPQLSLKHEYTVGADQLANPSRVMKGVKKDSYSKIDLPEGQLAFASLSFLKAVKKTLVYNLSASGNMLLFGNYVVARVAETSAQYSVVQVDPVLLANGDIVVSLSQRNKLALFDSAILNLDHVFQEMASCFVIYVVPSGLRCHLYDTSSMQHSFTYTPPKSSVNLLRLLKLSTGVELKQKQQILWVKLVPNLQHLNNQTSKISHFVHEVDNKKYILWPWELCLLQFGSVEKNPIHDNSPLNVDPLSLISDFIQFSILRHENDNVERHMETLTGPGSATNHITTHPPFSVPSAFSIGMSTEGNDKHEDTHMSILETNPEVLGLFEIDHNEDLFGSENVLDVPLLGSQDRKTKDKGSELEMKEDGLEDDSDLFGSSPELDSKQAGEALLEDFDPRKSEIHNMEVDSQEALSNSEKTFEDPQGSENEALDIKSEIQPPSAFPGFINIPRDQMISGPANMTPMSYDDPGAPPAIMPTPMIPTPVIPQNVSDAQGGFGMQAIPHPHTTPKVPLHLFPQPGKPLNPFASRDSKEAIQGEDNLAYVFSPILFNPMIKSNIDTKYGKGGKFYVARESSTGPEEFKFRLRETSVSGFDSKKELSEGKFLPELLDSVSSSKDSKIDNTFFPDGALIQKEDTNEEAVDDDVNEEDEEDDEEDEEEDEESDVDEEDVIALKTSPPLKLNTHDIFQMLNAAEILKGLNVTSSLQSNQSNNFLSPGSSILKVQPSNKVDSPFGFSMGTLDVPTSSLSPPILNDLKQDSLLGVINRSDDLNQQTDNGGNKEPGTAESANTPLSNSSSGNGISESSNCLPLILRNINVVSIPNCFIVKKAPGVWGNVPISTGFNMDVDEEEDEFDVADGTLSVRLMDLDECLKWLMPNLVFDLGLINFEKRLQIKFPEFFSEKLADNITDGEVSSEVKDCFLATFPLSYRVKLIEFVNENEDLAKDVSEPQREIDNRLSFLDDITNNDILDEETSSKKMMKLHWDSIHPELKVNQQKFKNYCELVTSSQTNSDKKNDDGSVFSLNEVKTKVFKNGDNIINLNVTGIKFWNYFNFSPLNGPKRFQVLVISENDARNQDGNLFDSSNLDFLELLRSNYKEGHFGTIKKLNLQTSDTRPDLDGISNGLMLVDKGIGEGAYREFYKKINKKLKSLAELIKLDIINKTNRFEFDRPLLLLFVNFDSSINSVLQISKICRNFKLFLNDHQLSLVNTFTQIIPWNYIITQSDMRRRLRYLSNSKLSKISMSLYNKCPNVDNHDSRFNRDNTRKLYTNLVKEPPSTLHFKFMNKVNKEGYTSSFHDDIFLHVAYERSVDKSWVSAAWSDPLGIVTHTKSWYCLSKARTNGADAHELGSIINDIWDISNNFFKTLNDDAVQRTCGSGAKNFLVLTRISSIIPDDELVFWKKLTTKHKDISLLVLSANRLPKYIFSSEPRNVPSGTSESTTGVKNNFDETTPNFIQNLGQNRNSISSSMSGPDFFKSINGMGNVMSPSSSGAGFTLTSPMNSSALSFHSPQQFLNAPSNFLSPLDAAGTAGTGLGLNSISINEADYIIKDPCLEILGVIPKIPLPSFNSPTRLGMRIGYLIRESKTENANSEVKDLVFEVTLLSCSSYWNLDAIMKILLNQYKKLIVLNDVMGTCDREPKKTTNTTEIRSLVPWHINAVVKTIDYLVHVNVDEPT